MEDAFIILVSFTAMLGMIILAGIFEFVLRKIESARKRIRKDRYRTYRRF